MRSPRAILLSACALYAAALAVSWHVCTRMAVRKAEHTLSSAEIIYKDSLDDSIDAILLHVADTMVREIGTVRDVPTEELTSWIRTYNIDEANIVRPDGICIASSDTSVLGSDFMAREMTRPFLEVLVPGHPSFRSQSFRHGASNPSVYRKYLSFAFADRSGFLQVGYDFKRVASVIDTYDLDNLVDWVVGATGHYDLLSPRRPGMACDFPADAPDGTMVLASENGKPVFCRAFSVADHRFVAILPRRECFEQRNLAFFLLAPALAAVVLFLAFFVRSLSRAQESDERRRAAENEARSRDLALARTIQRSCLPSSTPYRHDILSLSFEALAQPAKEVGGDFYDFYFRDPAHLVVTIADVSGKGVPAAMFMMETKSELFAALRERKDPTEAVAEANRRICARNDAAMFVTAWVGVIDIAAGTVEYVNAGHNRPFLRRADGSMEKLMGRGGRFLGMFPDATYRSETLSFRPGDTLFLFTDGVTEAMNGFRELYGEKRLVEFLRTAQPDADTLPKAVAADVHAFAAGTEQSDDLTALALVWHGVPEPRAKTFPAADASFAPAMAWLAESIGTADRKAKARLLNAADEIMTNIVHYSGATSFSMSVENAPGRTRLVFTDDGREFNPLTHADPDTHAPLEKRTGGGLGILITKRLVETISYQREGNRNVLTLVKMDASAPSLKSD